MNLGIRHVLAYEARALDGFDFIHRTPNRQQRKRDPDSRMNQVTKLHVGLSLMWHVDAHCMPGLHHEHILLGSINFTP